MVNGRSESGLTERHGGATQGFVTPTLHSSCSEPRAAREWQGIKLDGWSSHGQDGHIPLAQWPHFGPSSNDHHGHVTQHRRGTGLRSVDAAAGVGVELGRLRNGRQLGLLLVVALALDVAELDLHHGRGRTFS